MVPNFLLGPLHLSGIRIRIRAQNSITVPKVMIFHYFLSISKGRPKTKVWFVGHVPYKSGENDLTNFSEDFKDAAKFDYL